MGGGAGTGGAAATEQFAWVDALLDAPVFIAPFVPFFDPRVGRPATPHPNAGVFHPNGRGTGRGCMGHTNNYVPPDHLGACGLPLTALDPRQSVSFHFTDTKSSCHEAEFVKVDEASGC